MSILNIFKKKKDKIEISQEEKERLEKLDAIEDIQEKYISLISDICYDIEDNMVSEYNIINKNLELVNLLKDKNNKLSELGAYETKIYNLSMQYLKEYDDIEFIVDIEDSLKKSLENIINTHKRSLAVINNLPKNSISNSSLIKGKVNFIFKKCEESLKRTINRIYKER
jgi:hypothetical protein